MKGILITFEGIDGAGKTTQWNKLATYLKGWGYPVETIREPGGNAVSEKIRDLLLDVHNEGIRPMTEAFLYAAARAQLVEEVLKPLLAKGTIVLADRFTDSTIAYQGYGRGMDIDLLGQLNRLATGGLKPDLTILLDLDVTEAVKRMQWNAPDRMESQGAAFRQKVREGYLALAAGNERIVVIDANQPEAEVSRQIYDKVVTFLKGLQANG
ncbi:MAG: dTMP kinase [Candidatus Saccharibacteria bacterium]